MKDKLILQQAAREFPTLLFPVFGTLLAVRLVKNAIPGRILMALLYGLEQTGAVDPDGEVGILFLLSIPLLFVTTMISTLLNLGAFRLCLDRGEGRTGKMPWTIFKEGRWYISWAVWMGVFPVIWRIGKQVLFAIVTHTVDADTVYRLYSYQSYWNVALTLLNLVLFMLLSLSIKTAYLRTPEQGFWRAVGFGLKEGFQKWPQTIGPQIKFVVPVSVGMSLISILLAQLSFQMRSHFISNVCNLTGSLVSLLAETWVLIFYGILAAWRYAPPDGVLEEG